MLTPNHDLPIDADGSAQSVQQSGQGAARGGGADLAPGGGAGDSPEHEPAGRDLLVAAYLRAIA